MRYAIYTVDEKHDYILLALANDDKKVQDAVAEQIRKAPTANIQICMVN